MGELIRLLPKRAKQGLPSHLESKGAEEWIVKSFFFRSMLVQTSGVAYSLME